MAFSRTVISVWTATVAALTRRLYDLISASEEARACSAVSVTRTWLAWISASAMTVTWA